MGWPKGREPQGDGVVIVVVRVTSHQGERESRSQGEARQGVGWTTATRYARCEEPDWSCPSLTTGELLDIERVTSSSERGGWKRAEFQYLAGRLLYVKHGSEGGDWKSAHRGNSLAAYPTSCPVLK